MKNFKKDRVQRVHDDPPPRRYELMSNHAEGQRAQLDSKRCSVCRELYTANRGGVCTRCLDQGGKPSEPV